MNTAAPELLRIQSLLDIVHREGRQLLQTDQRLFTHSIDDTWVMQLEKNIDLAERVDAFVSRFGRMQDTLGDKLLPAFLALMGERPGPALDNLNRAEKFGWIDSRLQWMEIRNQRNLLVHEYIKDPKIFADALQNAHQYVPNLLQTYNRINRAARQHYPHATPWADELEMS